MMLLRCEAVRKRKVGEAAIDAVDPISGRYALVVASHDPFFGEVLWWAGKAREARSHLFHAVRSKIPHGCKEDLSSLNVQ